MVEGFVPPEDFPGALEYLVAIPGADSRDGLRDFRDRDVGLNLQMDVVSHQDMRQQEVIGPRFAHFQGADDGLSNDEIGEPHWTLQRGIQGAV